MESTLDKIGEVPLLERILRNHDVPHGKLNSEHVSKILQELSLDDKDIQGLISQHGQNGSSNDLDLDAVLKVLFHMLMKQKRRSETTIITQDPEAEPLSIEDFIPFYKL